MPENDNEFAIKVLLLLDAPPLYHYMDEEEDIPPNLYDELAYGPDFEVG